MKRNGSVSPSANGVLEGFSRSPKSKRKRKESSSPESEPFRGFEKIPRVLLRRLDIGIYLKKDVVDNKAKNPLLVAQLEHQCAVRLVRDNLEQLKEEVMRNSRLNRSNGDSAMQLRCKICEKAYSSEKKLQNHQENKHMLVYKPTKPQKRVSFAEYVTVHELREYHRCRKCPKIFEEYQSLKAHMKLKHRKRKCYICHYCSKDFVDRMFFKVHIKLHCDVCGRLFPNRAKYLEHRREQCRVVKKYECKFCHNHFFSFMDLRDHYYEHLETMFICDVCKEQFSSKCAISHHISFLHSDRRPRALYLMKNLGNERLYLCNFCDMSSVDKEVIENHVAVLPDLKNREWTGYKDYYFCDQCSQRFDTETSMVQHKWTHFLNKCDDSQTKQKSVLAKEFDTNKTYKIHGELPKLMQPKIVLQRIDSELNSTILSKYSCHPENSNCPTNSDSPNYSVNNSHSKNSNCPTNGNTNPNCSVESSNFKTSNCPTNSNTNPNYSVNSSNSKNSYPPKNSSSHSKNSNCLKNSNNPNYSVSPNYSASPMSTGTESNDSCNFDLTVKKAYIDPKSKKTLISRFQCEKCLKYYSSNFCLNRHIMKVHNDYSKLRCPVCEETFVWPSLLQSHNCIRMNIPEMPFQDARDEIQLQDYTGLSQPGFDELMSMGCTDSDDYMNAVDFEIPAPIVELIEYENCLNLGGNQNNNFSANVSNGYKIVVQEVPIEF